ncbi:MAG TPA: polyphosphate polymerase domain-containing protein [Microbacterium sp.]|nr:polyphosphate polymerase domain-containing protein [Microbacterium sp.]
MNVSAALLRRLPAVSLGELEQTAALMQRVDRKYLVPLPALEDALARISDDCRALEINGLRTFRYRSVYLDSADFRLYRQHIQGRRRRFKVRTRTYIDSGGCHLEVKSKGPRGETLKERIPHAQDATDLPEASRTFVSSIIGMDAAALVPVVQTDYRRSTLVYGDHRITLDTDLLFRAGGRRARGPAEVLVETKSTGRESAFDRMLVHHGIRPHRVSKYCLAASLLYPHLPDNDFRRLKRRCVDATA